MPQLKLENSLVDDRYEVRERLGLGSYAEIFVVRDREAGGREVVIKALNTHLQGTPDAELESTLVENFQNEALALDAVRHPHVILRMGHGTAADLADVPFHYLVLEYMPGGDLLRLCRLQPGNALPLSRALGYFKQVCEALAYAHSKGIIHRDLKPNNFLLSADQQTVKVADFGVAKITGDENAEITRVGAGVYAPPEHHPDDASGHVGRLTAAADIYSLAKSVYTVVCGNAPNQFTRRQITSLPLALSGEPWAGRLLAVLRRATAGEVDDRYASVIEFWSDLADVASAIEVADEEKWDDAATLVRPRLEVSPKGLPAKPARPEFEPLTTNDSIALPATVANGSAAQAPADELRPPKIVVALKPEPEPVSIPAPRRAATEVATAPPVKSPTPKPPRAQAVEPAQQTALENFMAPLWRRLIVLVLAVAFLAALASVYRYAREKRHHAAPLPSLGLGAQQVEVVTENVNVRSGPGTSYDSLGAVARGTRHRVLNTSENGWVQIEVSQWSDAKPHAADQNQGWVYNAPQYVNITRRLW